MNINPTKILTNRLFTKSILNFWTIVTMAFFVIDFFSNHQFNASVSAIGIIYLAILGIYTGEKEYARWKKPKFKSIFVGESFVVIWTLILFLFTIISAISNGLFTLPDNFIAIYTAIIGVFVVSRHSKRVKSRK